MDFDPSSVDEETVSRPAGPGWSRTATLTEILDDIRRQLRADTASVLLLDRSRTLLESAATVGLDRTVRRARRIPLGQGFAGRVAQTRQPVVLTDVNSSNVLNPVLLDHGVRTLLGVPIIDGSELLGVLHVGCLHDHEFGATAVLLLTEIAAVLAQALRQRFMDDAHVAALTLQRSLLPTIPSALDGLVIAARYVPAEGDLGGDWYDVFELPGDRLGLVMGDVVGHGLGAAVVMGRLKSVLRAYALEHDDPADVLGRLDRKICHFERDVFATVLFGVAEAPYAEWTFSSAGHPAPLIAVPDMAPAPVDLTVDRLVGFDPDTPRRSTRVSLPAGGSLCLFTDGLVERRPRPDDGELDIIGLNLERLSAALAFPDDPEMACIRVLAEVVGDHVAEDDIAILVAHRSETKDLLAEQ